MRHAVAGYKLGRDTEHRRSLFRNLAAALFQHGQITTTLPKAKAVQPFVERLITTARRGDLHARRRVIALLQDRELFYVHKGGQDPDEDVEVEDKTLIQKLFEEIAPRYSDRPGGYTRIVKLGSYRKGDGADLVVLQLVGEEEDNAPKMKGRHSRRRQIQNNRTAYAAKLRKGGAKGQQAEPAGTADEAAEGGAATAEAEPESQQGGTDDAGAQAPEQEGGGEASEEKKSE